MISHRVLFVCLCTQEPVPSDRTHKTAWTHRFFIFPFVCFIRYAARFIVWLRGCRLARTLSLTHMYIKRIKADTECWRFSSKLLIQYIQYGKLNHWLNLSIYIIHICIFGCVFNKKPITGAIGIIYFDLKANGVIWISGIYSPEKTK